MTSSFNKAGGDESYPQLDLSGKLIIKAQLGDDVRRIPIHNEAITYDELVLMMQRVFRSRLSSSDDITIKYKDEDGDLITIFDSSDLAFAVQYSRILKLQILVGSEEAQKNIIPPQIRNIRQELQKIRDQVNQLLDSLDPYPTEVTSSTADTRGNTGEQNHVASQLSSREFDPLQDQAQRQAAADREPTPKEEPQPADGRVNTPDSIGSTGSRRVSSAVDQTSSQPPQSQPPATGTQTSQPPVYQQQQPAHQSQSYQPGEQAQPQPPATQPYQGAVPAYQRYPVPNAFVGSSVMGQQPQMMVPGTGQQPVPQGAFRPAFTAYPGMQQPYAANPQAAAGAYRPTTPSQQPQGPQAYPQDFSVAAQGAYPFQGPGNPYSKGATFARPSSQPGYQ